METSSVSVCSVNILNIFQNCSKEPEAYLGTQIDLSEEIKQSVKSLYDYTKINEGSINEVAALPELIVQDFDEEQIWQELELQNDFKMKSLINDIALLVARRDRLTFPVRCNTELNNEIINRDEDDISKESENDEGDLKNDEIAEDEKYLSSFDDGFKGLSKKRKRKSVVDDDFFKLQELEKFLNNEDRKENSLHKKRSVDSDESEESDESVDFFEDVPSDGEVENEHYADFFDAPDNSNVSSSDEDPADIDDNDVDPGDNDIDPSDDDVDPSNDDNFTEGVESINQVTKSSFESRKDRLDSRISRLELEAVGEKPWQLKGEVSGESRPQNSLLPEIVEFDLTSRPAPIITRQTTAKLEDLIMQRIKDKVWDDVIRKVKPTQSPAEYKAKLVLDQEKSKLSLAQVYEAEYIQERDKNILKTDDNEPEEPENHKEIRIMMTSLFNKLDALSNYHYTPKPVLPEVKVISNIPAVTMEEVAPIAMTNASLLAPEEIKAKTKGDMIGLSERTDTDRKRERRHKKMKQRDDMKDKAKKEDLIKKLRPGLGNKYSKNKMSKLLYSVVKEKNVTKIDENNLNKIKSSTAFFTRLQDEVSTTIRAKRSQGNKGNKKEAISAKKAKL